MLAYGRACIGRSAMRAAGGLASDVFRGQSALRCGGRAFVGVGSGPAAVYLADDFADTVGTLLSAHTMNVGPGWTAGGAWQIFAASAGSTGGDGNVPAVSDAGHIDAVASVQLIVVATFFDPAIVSRYVNASNFCYWTQSGNLYAVVGGAFTMVGSSPHTPHDGDSLAMSWNGNTVTCKINGAALVTYTLTAPQIAAFGAATKYGLFANTNPEVRYGNFRVSAS